MKPCSALRLLTLTVFGTSLAACGSGGGATPTPTTTPAPSASASLAPTPSPTPAPSMVAWGVTRNSGDLEIRRASLTGTSGSLVATFSAAQTPELLAIGHGVAAVVTNADKMMHVVPLNGAAPRAFGAGTEPNYFGGAISPDGTHLAYVAAADPTHAHERLMDLATGAVTDPRSIADNKLDAPSVWTSSALAGPSFPGFADGGVQEVVGLDPATLARTGSTPLTGSCGVAAGVDALHFASTIHTALGDEGDSSGGPGPQQPCNTLRVGTIGGTVTTVLSEAHHSLSALWVGSDGTVLLSDGSAAGGFAGITLSPKFGLFLQHGTARTQLLHLTGNPWGAGTTEGDTVVVAQNSPNGTAAVSLEVVNAAAMSTTVIDGTADGYPVMVSVETG